MTREELSKSLQHVAAFYDMYFPSISEESFMAMHLHNLATVMWVREYPEDEHSIRIREQLNNLWTRGMLIFDPAHTQTTIIDSRKMKNE